MMDLLFFLEKKETCSRPPVTAAADPHHVNEWKKFREQSNRPVGVGVASKAVCLLGGQDSGFVRSPPVVVSFN
jgi:hypothetical protein